MVFTEVTLLADNTALSHTHYNCSKAAFTNIYYAVLQQLTCCKVATKPKSETVGSTFGTNTNIARASPTSRKCCSGEAGMLLHRSRHGECRKLSKFALFPPKVCDLQIQPHPAR